MLTSTYEVHIHEKVASHITLTSQWARLCLQITSLTFVYSTVYSGADQRKHQSSAPLAFVRGIHRGPVNYPHKWPATRKMFPFDDVIMIFVLNLCDRYVKYSYIIASTHANSMLDFSPIHHAYPLQDWIPSCYATFPLICAIHELAWCFHEVN